MWNAAFYSVFVAVGGVILAVAWFLVGTWFAIEVLGRQDEEGDR